MIARLFEGVQVRALVKDNQKWVYLCDFTRAMNWTQAGQVAARLERDEVDQIVVGRQPFNIINKAAIYRLSYPCRKPVARRLREWITNTLFPLLNGSEEAAIANATDTVSDIVGDDIGMLVGLERLLSPQVVMPTDETDEPPLPEPVEPERMAYAHALNQARMAYECIVGSKPNMPAECRENLARMLFEPIIGALPTQAAASVF